MVIKRLKPEIFFGGVQEDSAGFDDGKVIEMDDSNRAVGSQNELVAAFKRFVGLNSGSFLLLLRKWVASRRRSPFTHPQSRTVNKALKMALQDAFNQVRKKA